MEFTYVNWFEGISMQDVDFVGGKNASLGEMYQHLSAKGIKVPNGFVLNAHAYWLLLNDNQVKGQLESYLDSLNRDSYANLQEVGQRCRELMISLPFPEVVKDEVLKAYHQLQAQYNGTIQLAVRSSATAEDLPEASFAGQQESYLNIASEDQLLAACSNCYASLFTNRAIKYREEHGFEHLQVALSIGIQKMVRSDQACAGVCFTLDTETGFSDVISISGSWGLGENVVKGSVSPDEYYVFKPTLQQGKLAIINKQLGAKERRMVYDDSQADFDRRTLDLETSPEMKEQFVLSNLEVEKLAYWAMQIEQHYEKPMDIEWAKDGIDQEIYIVQARPETVHTRKEQFRYFHFKLLNRGRVLVTGKNIGERIASGRARVLQSPDQINELQEGEVLVTHITNPDWDPIMKKASAIITDRGGRTSHAAIVAREIGAIAVVGTGNATELIRDGQEVTVSCVEGQKGIVYDGKLDWQSEEINTDLIHLPKTPVRFILADPDQAFKLSFLPNDGVGLMRLEFVINHTIQIHPMALVRFDELTDEKAKQQIEQLTGQYVDKTAFFVDKLSEAVATIAAAFYPKEVVVRMSDFKTNEYAHLIGGEQFEPEEENPMLGWRGASRYYHPDYADGFHLECKAMKRVREDMGFTNVKLMIPFVRTIEEAHQVIGKMEDFGLKRGEQELQVYMMAEVPSNVILADEFAILFDGFSIGSNDLTQLTLGIDRDSERLASEFDAENKAVKKMVSEIIRVAHNNNVPVGLCGQAASDSPAFAAFLVKHGIDSVSFNPDALLTGIETINQAEKQKQLQSGQYLTGSGEELNG
jgi:pyruvate, water dikinase